MRPRASRSHCSRSAASSGRSRSSALKRWHLRCIACRAFDSWGLLLTAWQGSRSRATTRVSSWCEKKSRWLGLWCAKAGMGANIKKTAPRTADTLSMENLPGMIARDTLVRASTSFFAGPGLSDTGARRNLSRGRSNHRCARVYRFRCAFRSTRWVGAEGRCCTDDHGIHVPGI